MRQLVATFRQIFYKHCGYFWDQKRPYMDAQLLFQNLITIFKRLQELKVKHGFKGCKMYPSLISDLLNL